jgi:hypothetical protein
LIGQFRAQQEDPVEEQHGVRGGRRDRPGQRGVREVVGDRGLVPTCAVRDQRIEQDPAKRV